MRGTPLGRVKAVRRLRDWLLRRLSGNVPTSVKVGDKIFFLDKKDRLELSLRKIHEPLTTKLFSALVRRARVVIDVGAHIGYYSVLASREAERERVKGDCF